MPRRSQISFSPSPDLFPYPPQWFESPVGRVHYVDEGSGRPVLMLHGNPTWSFLYRTLIARLREDFRCVALDYPGFGLSDRPAGYGYTPGEQAQVVHALVEHLDLEDMVVVGQDWGGPIGLWVAAREPKRVGGLVFGNTWFWPVRRIPTWLFSRVLSTSLMQKAILERNFFVEQIMPRGVARPLSEKVMDHYRQVQPSPEMRLGVAEFPRQLRTAGKWLEELASRAPERVGHVPLLLVWGTRDFAFPPGAYIPRWRASFEDSVVAELPHAKHFIQEDGPEEMVMAIRSRFAPWGSRRTEANPNG